MCAWDKYKKPPAKIYAKKYFSKDQQEQTDPKNKTLSAIIKALKFAFISMLMIFCLFSEGIVAYDRKWYEWVIGAVLIIAISGPLIFGFTLLFHWITGFWPVN